MAMSFEDLRVLRSAEEIADGVWKDVTKWDEFARDVVGLQLTRAIDSVGANISEAFGRYHYGEKLQFLYYARGSLFEAKYWINRCLARDLITSNQGKTYGNQLTDLAKQLNSFSSTVKQNKTANKPTNKVREYQAEYVIEEYPPSLFDEEDVAWLESTNPTLSNDYWQTKYPISNTGYPISFGDFRSFGFA